MLSSSIDKSTRRAKHVATEVERGWWTAIVSATKERALEDLTATNIPSLFHCAWAEKNLNEKTHGEKSRGQGCCYQCWGEFDVGDLCDEMTGPQVTSQD